MDKEALDKWTTHQLGSSALLVYRAKISLAERFKGLYLLKKLSKEHVDLNSYSRMRVNLAAKVLSESIAEGFSKYGSTDTVETQRFTRMFDQFFDCLNVRHPNVYIKRRKPNLEPYSRPDDERLKWLKNTFLGYLKEWEDSVNARDDVPYAVKPTMLLSRATREGLQITVKSFVAVTKYLLSLPCTSGHYILSECFSQDPLENFFSQVRARGGYCKNPTFQSCLTSTQSLRVQGSLSMLPIRGNSCRKKRRRILEEIIDNTPLAKRPKQK